MSQVLDFARSDFKAFADKNDFAMNSFIREAVAVSPALRRTGFEMGQLLPNLGRLEILNLTWGEVQGRKLKLTNSKTGPRIVRLGPEARAVLAEFPRGKKE